MHPADVELSPDQRRREIAAVLAAGILRLRTCPDVASQDPSPAADTGSEETTDSTEKTLDFGRETSPPVHAG